MKRILLSIMCGAALALTACRAPAVTARPTATLIPTLAAPTPTPVIVPVVDVELLGAANVETACDAPPEATFACETVNGAPQLNAAVAASTY
uniref:hypothetical protein n=1 Tax=uncultured Arthrobacter sp. TaxID=114050 RepID=UPI0032179F03